MAQQMFRPTQLSSSSYTSTLAGYSNLRENRGRDFLFTLRNLDFNGIGSRALLQNNPFASAPAPAPAPEARYQSYHNHLKIAETPEGLEKLREMFLPNLWSLMAADKLGQQIFNLLLERCNGDFLVAILRKFHAEKQGFLRAAFCEPGSMAIQRFITKIKSTGLENHFTKLLAEFACPQFMNHHIASQIYRQCFVSFSEQPNEALHGCIFQLFDYLAIHPVGRITIKASMDSPRSAAKKLYFLHLVAEKASQLSKDPWGNYTVQNVLNLGNQFVCTRICNSLQGEFVGLAQKQGGSRVVEKCLKTDYGRVVVLEEIFKNNKTLLMLAKDRFGNYVVQTALKVTRMHDQNTYGKLVRVLKPRHSKLINKVDEWFAKKHEVR